MEKLDYKKKYKDLYIPKKVVSEVMVPNIGFIGVKGKGFPAEAEFQDAIALLYSYSFSIKMSKKAGSQPEGYFEYVVPPLEAIFGTDELVFDYHNKDTWAWTLMIRQPEFVNEDIFFSTKEALRKKKPELDVDPAFFFYFKEGFSLQVLHIGSYNTEDQSLEKVTEYMKQKSYIVNGKHHEIYLSDPRKTAIDKLKTVLRLPVTTLAK